MFTKILFFDFMPTDGSDFKGERLTVQFARGPRRKENLPGPMDRPSMPRPRRTVFRMVVSGLPETSWQVSSPTSFVLASRISHLAISYYYFDSLFCFTFACSPSTFPFPIRSSYQRGFDKWKLPMAFFLVRPQGYVS